MSCALRTLRSTTALPSTRRLFSTTPTPKAMARMTLIGNLTATPESAQTSSGRTLYRYTIAVNLKRDDEPSYYNIAAFVDPGQEQGSRAQLLAGLAKGTHLFVEADSKMVTLNPREGEERGRKVLNLVQRNIQILSPKSQGSSGQAE